MSVSKNLLFFFFLFFAANLFSQSKNESNLDSFSYSEFLKPSLRNRPMVRWWWPGNNVDKGELKRELQLLKDNGFSGAEIQSFKIGMNWNSPDSILNKWFDWDTDEYYDNLRFALKEAKRLDLVIDLTVGSGWPLAIPGLNKEESLKELVCLFTEVGTADFPRKINIPGLSNERVSNSIKFLNPNKELKYVMAAQILSKDGNEYRIRNGTQRIIEINNRNYVDWDKSEENWVLFAIYSIPQERYNGYAASKDPLLVVDHWDSLAIKKAYEHLFGNRTGLSKFFNNPIRSIFNDSYEFNSNIAPDFFQVFENENKYDVRRLLPQLLNNKETLNINDSSNSSFKFVSKEEIEKIRFDYEKTMGNLLLEHLVKGSNNWAKERSVLHRTQPYGPTGLDVIRGAGLADIPETEQLWDGGSEGFLKLVTSGAHLYNKPLITQESFVHGANRGMMTTPQKIKALSGKAFTAGVNQIIYHGFPYRINEESEYGKIGWSPFMPSLIASHINEANPFWSDIRNVNSYISRSQYVMKLGKPVADILVYYPLPSSLMGPNPYEALVGGYFEDFEPPAPEGRYWVHFPHLDDEMKSFWGTLNVLMEEGVTWDYIDEESLQEAQVSGGKIIIRGNVYQGLVLPEPKFVTLEATKAISNLAGKGASILLFGEIPNKQPGFFDYRKKDQEIFNMFSISVSDKKIKHIQEFGQIKNWIEELDRTIKFKRKIPGIRHSMRILENGSLVDYLWNMSSGWKNVRINGIDGLKNYYWLDPSTGEIMKNGSGEIEYSIPPFSSIILLATIEDQIPIDAISPNLNTKIRYARTVVELKKWNIVLDEARYENSFLFDWKDKNETKYYSGQGVYSTGFLFKKNISKPYLLDLGKLSSTAKVWINDKMVGKSIWNPNIFYIGKYLKDGTNEIKIQIIPPMLNELIGLGKGSKKGEVYFPFNGGDEPQLISSGLLGPVVIKEL